MTWTGCASSPLRSSYCITASRRPSSPCCARPGSRSSAGLIFETGASGVELFFVLSGIVLLRPYLRRERSFKPAVYAGRRIAASFWPWAAGRVAGFGVVRVPAPRYVTDP